ncbi:MAG: FAD-dependent oxidoreductase [Actinomycetota bacterium]|nr:FAD-dependent oxidoreductase [Actinomycetota bacterium]
MPHVVTQACCGDASCVFACPVNCIHPSPDEPDFLTAEMLYIDPDSCVDCGACVSACPVGAIMPDSKVPADQLPFVDINALFFANDRPYPIQAPVPATVKLGDDRRTLRVAVVGSGPAALYAADELLKQSGVEVNVFDKLPTPYGLVRAGVAPDHQRTKTVDGLFRQIEDQDGFGYFLNVGIGTDLSHAELLAHHHAVLYATGASVDRALGIPGEELPGSVTATDFVAWYNGHPDFADRVFEFSDKRAVIVGNGNVALDVARILTSDPAELALTDIAEHALEALRRSQIEEVVLLARRGVAQAAFTLPELVGLLSHHDVDFVVDGSELVLDPVTARHRAAGDLDPGLERKIVAMEQLAASPDLSRRRKRIVFRYLVSPTEFTPGNLRVVRNRLEVDGGGVVGAVATATTESIDTQLMLRSIGYRGVALTDIPFDEATGVVPNDGGRVTDTHSTYVAGWIKRGPSGYIGTNKTCAHETVSNLLRDFNDGLLPGPAHTRKSLAALVAKRKPDAIDLCGWRAIDTVERGRGHASGKVRQKFTDTAEMVDTAHLKRPTRRRFARTST